MTTVLEGKSENSTASRSSYISGIDALRALAVTSVIIYHLHEGWLPGGFVGVDIFFAISGYLITKTLLERSGTSAWRFFTGFYRRRFQRIAPALFVYVATVAALTAYFVPKSFLGQGALNTAKWAVFGASNIQLVASSDGYFGDRMPYNPFVQTWSLGVEEQFYLIYPIILLLVGIGLQRSSRLLAGIGKLILISLTVGSLVFCVWQTTADPLRSFYLLPARFWELAVGALLYLLVSRVNGHRLNNPAHNRAFFGAGVLLVGVSLAFATVSKFPFWWAIPAVFGGLAMIHVAHNVPDGPTSRTRELLTSRPVVFIGKISYSLYLWHWGIFVLMRWTIGIESPATKLLAVALTLLASWLSYKFVETPPRRNAWVKGRPDLAVILAGVLAGLLCFHTVSSVTAWAVKHNKKASVPWFRDARAIEGMLNTIPKTSVGRGHKVVFVGDSHAGHYSYIAKWTANKTNSSFLMVRQYGCGFVNLMHAAPSTCPTDQDMIDRLKLSTTPGDIVVLSSFSLPRIAQLWGPLDKQALLATVRSEQSDQDRAAVLATSFKTVQTLQKLGLHIVLAAPTPVFEAPPDRCHRWFNRHNPVCLPGFKTDRGYQLDLRAPVMKSYQTLSQQTGAILWDPFPLLCPADPCRSEVNDRFRYIDQHHLSANGNLVVFRSFLKLASSIWDGSYMRSGFVFTPAASKP
jgi:peptidoglycan/LPS O-acetylase OafA/YrhL